MADRPQNYCRDCGYQWPPRGSDRAARCPGCRGPNVGAVLSLDDTEPAPQPPSGGASAVPKVLAFVILGAVFHLAAGVLAVRLLRDDPAPGPAEVAAAKKSERPAPAAPAPPVPGRTKEKKLPAAAPAPVPDDVPLRPTALDPEPVPAPVPKAEPAPPDPPPPDLTPKPPPPTPAARPPHPFPPPPMSWESAWEKAGDVRIRVCGVAVTKVPLEARKRKFLSPDTYFVVWVEIENTSKADHTYRRWQPVTTGECTLRFDSGAALPYAIYPSETGREWFAEFSQPLPAGGQPVLESLAFSRPDPNADGPLTLTLDATRAGGTGRVSITIPHTVWARRTP